VTLVLVTFLQSRKLADVCYDIRGPVLAEAQKLEREGHRILKLNIGNPAPFGFEAPEGILADVVAALPTAQGYCDSQGIVSARRAVVQYHQAKGVEGIDVDDVYLGNGVSELIVMALQALLDDGDEVLIPAPDYPLWTAAVSLAGGRPVHYLCDESAGWQPDLDDLAAKVTDRTKGVVVINPNNPTGAVYGTQVLEGIADVARRHGLVLFSDEIYDQILYGEATHTATAALAPDVLCLTFNGLSKAYRLAGFRSGWLVVSGPTSEARSYIEGLTILANMRLCANVPAQHAIATALGGRHGLDELVLPGGRLREQRDTALRLLAEIPGVSCVEPDGALYLFPRLDPDVYDVKDDQQLVLDLLREQHLLLVQGTGFNWPDPDHLRIVTLPHVDDLTEAIGRLDEFLARRR
jgi:alanine-synthesizing transaminase